MGQPQVLIISPSPLFNAGPIYIQRIHSIYVKCTLAFFHAIDILASYQYLDKQLGLTIINYLLAL
jgi:hypothetical protein